MRISYWSSYVCSSDLALHPEDFVARAKAVVLVATAARVLGRPVPARIIEALMGDQRADWSRRGWVGRATTRRSLGKVARSAHIDATLQGFAATSGAARAGFLHAMAGMDLRAGLGDIARSEEPRVGKGCVSPFRYRGWPVH